MDIEEEQAIIDLKLLRDKYCKTIPEYQKSINYVLNELEKKDKVINEMAKFIAGLDIDELICKDREHCTGDYEYETCEECIIEYFTNKAENVGE